MASPFNEGDWFRSKLVVLQSRPSPRKLNATYSPQLVLMKQSKRNNPAQRTPPRSAKSIVRELRKLGSEKSVKGMSRFGIETSKALGVPVPQLRALAKEVGINHDLAQEVWRTSIHEARILASMIDDPVQVTEDQMERWAKDFDSWDVVDGCCGNLFDRTPYAVPKAHEWSARQQEYVKRAGFVLMAGLAVHDKKVPDKTFFEFLTLIVREASDERNFVRKAVNWALRQIGKRNLVLNKAAIRICNEIRDSDSRSAKWIAADALRELTSAPVRRRLASARGGTSKVTASKVP